MFKKPHCFFNFISFKNIFLDAIFPWHCCFCKKEVRLFPLCPNCQKSILINHSFICPICHKRIINLTNKCCSKNNFIYALGSATSYKDPILKKALHLFKYQHIISLQQPLSNLMIKFLKNAHFITQFNSRDVLLVPVPLYSKKQKQRGYNQSELLAKNLSLYFKFSLNSEFLLRIKNNSSQTKIQSFDKKKENVNNIFQCSEKNTVLLKNKLVLLIDDVYTSGATMQEAAKILKQHGAKKIIGLVLAKG